MMHARIFHHLLPFLESHRPLPDFRLTRLTQLNRDFHTAGDGSKDGLGGILMTELTEMVGHGRKLRT